MNRLKKVLNNKGLTWPCGDTDPYESECEFITIANDFIITFSCCNVLNSTFMIYDRNFNPIGEQNAFYNHEANNGKGWESKGITVDKDGVWTFTDIRKEM